MNIADKPSEKKKAYFYKDREYRKIGVTLMKHPETRKWVGATLYIGLHPECLGRTFVRESKEFDERFEERDVID